LSRLNQEIREHRGWSYGMGTGVVLRVHQSAFVLNAPVQADRTGDAIRVMMAIMADFHSTSGITPAERERVISGDIRSLPGSFETAASVLGALRTNALYHRPDEYWNNVASRYRAMSGAEMDAAARAAIDPARLVWVVVGDASAVRPQLEGLGLGVEVVHPAP
jgi:zinc protease